MPACMRSVELLTMDSGPKPGIYDLPFSVGNQFSTGTGTVSPILMILTEDPLENLISIKC